VLILLKVAAVIKEQLMYIPNIRTFLSIVETDEFIVTEPPYSKTESVTDKLCRVKVESPNQTYTRAFDVGIIAFLTDLTSSLIATVYSADETCALELDDDLEALVFTNCVNDELKVAYKGQIVSEGMETQNAIFQCLKALAKEMRAAVNEGRTVPSYMGGPRLNIGWGAGVISIPQ
jgi:hypothetical protein